MFKCITFYLLLTITYGQNNSCDNSTYNITILQSVDGELEVLTSHGRIALKKDSFSLLIKNDSLPKICENLFDITTELSVIQILNSGVQHIEKNAFRVVPTLALLKISNNLLTNITNNIFNNVKVKEIDLSNNFITNIEADSFDNITNLEIVKLNHNLLKEIDPDWFKNTSMYKLSIIYNELTGLGEDTFKNFVRTKALKLRLSANQISKMEPSSFGFRNVSKLRLNGNKLTSLPNGLCDRNNTISELQVNTNDLKCFPQDLYDDCGLSGLEFFENALFECDCLKNVRRFVESNNVSVIYPSIICEDVKNDVNVVYNLNRTQEIPLILTEGKIR